ncbi:ribbon-helix-helix protein, CopG family [Candidatus Nitrospira bockiana]
MAVLTVRLDQRLHEKLRRLSKEAERSKSYFIKKEPWSST